MRAQVISFNCILKNKAGHIISSTYNRDVLNRIGSATDGTLSGLTKNLQNLTKGERRTINVPAQEAYGFYDPQKIIYFPRKKIPYEIKPGQAITIIGKTGTSRDYRVLELHADMVRLDGNHPLAGQDLIFEIETLQVREATDLDLSEDLNPVSNQLLH